MKPLISVIIPCYNSAQYVTHAIDAILCQTYPNIEIILVDDNSTDNLQEVVESYIKTGKIIYKKNEFDDPLRYNKAGKNINAGFSARNFGVSIAKGELITFQDADDGSCSNRLEVQYHIMQKYNSHHVNVDWQEYQDKLNCKKLDYEIQETDIISSKEILKFYYKSRKGLFKKPFGKNEDQNPIEKFIRRVDRKFFRDWPSYPTAASMPLLKKEVFEKCNFRQLYDRTMPSWRGRGTDCDFNFWVAATFKNSIAVKIPLILWRAGAQNPEYIDNKYKPL